MKKNKEPPPVGSGDLRERAENKAGNGVCGTKNRLTHGQTSHELHVYQIELEMQNEELRRVQIELEASRARYFNLYDLAPVGYCTINETSLIVEANLAIAEMFGENRDALVNRPFSRFIVPEDQDVFYMLRRRFLKTNTIQVCELRLLKKNKISFWAQLVASPCREVDCSTAFNIVVIDVSERFVREDALKKDKDELELQVCQGTDNLKKVVEVLMMEQKRFNDVMEMLPVYVVLRTPDHRVKFANRFFHERFGTSKSEYPFEHPFKRTEAGETNDRFRQKATNAHYHQELIGPDKRNYDIYEFPFIDADGSSLIMEVGIDITDQKHAEAALMEANEMKLLGRITSGVAHEVRNPLSGIMAIMGALSKEISDDDRFQPYMRHMRNQVSRLSVLMEDLLVLGKPLREENTQEVSMVVLVEKALATWLQTKQPSAKPIVRLIKPGLAERCMVKADGASITQMIINILENACNHSPANSEIVCFVGCRSPGEVLFSVKDSGSGIAAEIMPKIFDPFFTMRKGGTGLGLSIVRRIVENHQGSIIATNNTDGPGVTFTARFPLFIKG